MYSPLSGVDPYLYGQVIRLLKRLVGTQHAIECTLLKSSLWGEKQVIHSESDNSH